MRTRLGTPGISRTPCAMTVTVSSGWSSQRSRDSTVLVWKCAPRLRTFNTCRVACSS
ncbi:Uncharacterised protein [Mycobacteroides abscessus subsp. abscessus]|nr:Uncharacterised protein [Mycobacteroides abscessus subsp. abscessus]